jgi:hypothetical protein
VVPSRKTLLRWVARQLAQEGRRCCFEIKLQKDHRRSMVVMPFQCARPLESVLSGVLQIIIIMKLPLYVIIHYIGTTKQALTLHIKPLGPSLESGSCVFHLSCIIHKRPSSYF